MSVKIRLQRKGRKKKPFYHIVVADARAKRDGRLIEKIGSYNPLTVPATIQLDREKAFDWLMKGAQPTNTVKAIMRYNGVYYRKHLMRGVAKGAMTEEQAMEKYNVWVAEKEAAIEAEVAKTAEKTKAYHRMIDGKAPEKKVAVAATAEGADAKPEAPKTLLESIDKTEIDTATGAMVSTAEVTEEVIEETPAPVVEATETVVVEEAPAIVEEVKEEVATPAPEVVEEKVEEVIVEATETVVVEEAPTVVEEVIVEAPAPVVEEVKVETPKGIKFDDLKVIEGIGPKIAELLAENGVDTWQKLSDAQPDALKEILAKGGARYTMHNPTTWPQQALLCVEGKWDELKDLQDRLDGGVEKDA